MKKNEIISWIDKTSETRKQEILNSPDNVDIPGTTYYVSNSGNDENDGKSAEHPWQTLERVNSAELCAGDGVLLKRGDVFRGSIVACEGVTYAAYGEGPKPAIYSWKENLASDKLWELYDGEKHIWKYKKKITDCGTLVFDDGKKHSRKLIPSYKNGMFVCRDNEDKPFDMREEMTKNLDLFTPCCEEFTSEASKGEDFPIPVVDYDSYGEMYLRCDEGNPGEVFTSIEAIAKTLLIKLAGVSHVHIDNLCLKYACFGVSGGGRVNDLKVTNCEIGWIGGNIQNYFGTDPNYPQGRRGSVTRFGNGVEIYGGCDGYEVSGCYIYEAYDAGITHQITTHGDFVIMKNIIYKKNLVERCVYGIEYFLEKNDGDADSYMESIVMSDNILRMSGYGWGQQRHNVDTPALIKGWSYENTAHDFVISNNIFDRSAFRMLHLVAKKPESCPEMRANTYIQNDGFVLGQYGANEAVEPDTLTFGKDAKEVLTSAFGEVDTTVYLL